MEPTDRENAGKNEGGVPPMGEGREKGALREAIVEGIARLHKGARSLTLATQNKDGTPDLSVAPYVFFDGAYWVFLSRLARRTANLRRDGAAALMLAQDESEAPDVYARARLSFSAKSSEVGRDEPTGRKAMELLARRFGPTFETLSALPDFALFRLIPGRGRLILGFGKAFNVSAESELKDAAARIGKDDA